jgi:hypothetical protein
VSLSILLGGCRGEAGWECEGADCVFVDRTLSLAIKDDVEDLTGMFQNHGAGMWSNQIHWADES